MVSLKRKILITGASGYLASHLVNALIGHGYEHEGQSNPEIHLLDKNFKKERFNNLDSLNLIEADINDINEFEYDIVVHAAYLLNLEAEKNFINKINQDTFFVFYSSAAVYGECPQEGASEETEPNPINDYGRYKLDLEKHIQKNLTNYLILRIANPYGKEYESRGVYKIFEEKIKSNKELKLFADHPGQMIRDFIHVDDLNQKIINLFEQDAKGIFNISSGLGQSLEAMVEQISGRSDYPINYAGYKEEIKYSVLRSKV